MLCPRSPTYWRTNRADGQPYEPVGRLEVAASERPTVPSTVQQAAGAATGGDALLV